MKKFWKMLVVMCVGLTLLGCSSTQTETPTEKAIKIIDQSGREVVLNKPAKRIASGYYIATTTIIGLGAKDTLVGVEMKAESREIYKQAAPEILDLPALGNKKMFHVEECAKAKPEVVFLPISLQSYVDKLEDLGIKVILLNPETNESFDEALHIIAKVCGREKIAQEYLDYRKNLLQTYIKQDMDENKTIYMAGMELLEAASDTMFQGEIIKAAKGVNAIKKGENSSWMNINIETLLEANPSYILLEHGGIHSEAVYANSALSELDAIKQKHVYVFPSTLETWDTPNLSYCLGTLWTYAILHPEDVTMEDVKKEAKAFYKKFYGIDVHMNELGI